MGFGIQIKVDPSKAIKKLKAVQLKLDNKEMLSLAGEHLLYWIDHNFQDEGTEAKWKPLSLRTIAGRRKSGGGAKILQDTGRLKMSFVKGKEANIFKTSGTRLEVGSEDPRAIWHHKGTYSKKGNIHLPSRPLIPSDSLAGSIVFKAIKAYVSVIESNAKGMT